MWTTMFTKSAIISYITHRATVVIRAGIAVLWALHSTFFAVKAVSTIVTKSVAKITSGAGTGAVQIALTAVVPCITWQRWTLSWPFIARIITTALGTRTLTSISIKSWFTSSAFGFRWTSSAVCRIKGTCWNVTKFKLILLDKMFYF